MEKAILKTLIYADIFDYPLTIFEIHKWLIGRKITLKQVEKTLGRLSKKRKVKSKKGYYFLAGRKMLVAKRQQKGKHSKKFLRKAKFIVWFLKFIPWIKLIGISGGLAMGNADKKDDIDLFLITSKNRLWISRLVALIFLDFLGVRRKARMKPSQVAGKLCLNILLEEDRLAQNRADIYLAHEVLQMKVLWSRNRIYQKYLEDNEWVFRFLPNWTTNNGKWKIENGKLKTIQNSQFGWLENLAKWLQLRIMGQPKGMERIENGALYFHPNDIRPQILKDNRIRLKKFLLNGAPVNTG